MARGLAHSRLLSDGVGNSNCHAIPISEYAAVRLSDSEFSDKACAVLRNRDLGWHAWHVFLEGNKNGRVEAEVVPVPYSRRSEKTPTPSGGDPHLVAR